MSFLSLRLPCILLGALALAGCTQHASLTDAGVKTPITLDVPQHSDFGHYTLALTWQPGFCSGPKGMTCNADQPHDPLIGLHGLWASRPADIIKAGVPVTTWWQKGCALYSAETHPTTFGLSAELAQKLSEIVAHTHSSLVEHEYKKHVQCFGMNEEQFFTAAAALRTRFASLPSARKLEELSGQTITKTELVKRLRDDTGPLPARGVQFQCNKTAQGETVLSQIWFTLKPSGLTQFPNASAFMSSPQEQDNCPAQFLLPQWAASATP